MQSATVTVRSTPGEQVTQPSTPSICTQPHAGVHGLDHGPVHLAAEDDRVEAGHRVAEGAPSAHDFADWRLAPEAEVEPSSRPGAARGDPCDDATTAPGGELVRGSDPGEALARGGCAGVIPRGGSEDPGGRRAMAVRLPRPRSGWCGQSSCARSPPRARAAARRCARTRARSVRRCGWCSSLPRQGPRAAWPCPRGFRRLDCAALERRWPRNHGAVRIA